MYKILLKTLIYTLISSSLWAQGNSLSITAGYKMVGSIATNENIWWCGSEYSSVDFATQKLSSLNAPTLSILYGQNLKYNWKFILGFNHNKKGYGMKYDESMPTHVKSKDEYLFTHNGILIGTEKLFYQKQNVILSGSFLLNYEWYLPPTSYSTYISSNSPYANMSAIIGVNADYKLHGFLSLRLNPFGEMSIFGFQDIIAATRVIKQRLYGFGFQAGLIFNFKQI
jgi:hypothetical protein